MVNMITDEQVRSALPWRAAVESLRAGFAGGSTATVPQRHHHAMSDAEDAPTLLLMPAWSHSYVGIKIVAVFPSNRGTDVPTINGNYLLMDGATGVPLAVLDGGELTARRTAAASVLAATLLSRPESSRLVVVGAGRLAGNLARAYAEHFALTDIAVWNHRPAGAERLAAELAGDGLPASATTELPSAVADADIVTTATLSSEPVVRGAWLAPGTHLDLVGAFTPTMREADDECLRRGSLFVVSVRSIPAIWLRNYGCTCEIAMCLRSLRKVSRCHKLKLREPLTGKQRYADFAGVPASSCGSRGRFAAGLRAQGACVSG